MSQDDDQQFAGTGATGDDGTTPGAGNPPTDESIQEEVMQFMQATPPPEPRGSAYISAQDFISFATTVSLPVHPTAFPEKYFLFLFAGSLSLQLSEKRDIIEKLPSLSQFQINELIKILEEEKQKFDELEKKHPEQVQKLRTQAASEWQILEMDSHKEDAVTKDTEEADEIRKKLGL